MQLRCPCRLGPVPSEREALARVLGCARVVFDDALAVRQAAREAGEPYVSDAELPKRPTQSRKAPERARPGEVPPAVLPQALADLNTACRNFFASAAGKREGPEVSAPRFRSRKDRRQAIRFTAGSRFKVPDNGRLRLPEAGM